MSNRNKSSNKSTAKMLTQSLGQAAILAGIMASANVSASQAQPETQTITPNIVGGHVTSPNSRPYQVALLMNGRQGCGGTLIAPQWVLTAAHCLDNASTSSLTVRVGAHSISANDGTTIAVSQIINHESWRGANGVRSGYDIGLLRLAQPASSSIKPAKLATPEIENQYASVGQYVTVSGWGLTYNQGRPSDVLREVDLPVISNASCSSELNFNLPSSVICGGGPNGTSACNGDSGGPYAVEVNGDFYSIGTVSWGQACSGATAFTRTTSYVDWIQDKIGVVVEDENPVARFSASVNDLSVSFSNSSTDDNGVVSSHWNFGDGNSSDANQASHTYAQAGQYTVTLTVTDTIGQKDTSSQLVNVDGGVINPPGCDGLAAWSASASYALDDMVSYKDAKYKAIWWSTGAQPDIYTNVWQHQGACDGTVDNQAPAADFSFSSNQLAVAFTNLATDDKAVVSYSWSFGDNANSDLANPSHNYSQAGSYQVSLTVADAEGLTDTVTKTVTVSEGNNTGCAGLAVWSADAVYNTGESVAYMGVEYTANWWSQGDDPAQNSGPWQVWTNQGACN